LILLVPGFFLQILGVIKVQPPEVSIWGLWIIWFVIIMGYLVGWRDIILDKRIDQIEDVLKKRKEEDDKRKGR